MAKETKTVQCYPSDSKINEMCARYGAFGWELIGNQRCEEDEGTYDGYRHWSTFNKLTFTREKTSDWYNEVTDVEREYESKEAECKKYKNLEPNMPTNNSGSFGFYLSFMAVVLIAVGAIMLFMAFGMDPGFDMGYIIGPILLAVGILRFVLRAVRKNSKWKQYNKDLAEWKHRYSDKIDELEEEMKELMKQAEKIVNA